MNTTVQIAGRNISENLPDGIVIEISGGKEDFEISIPENTPVKTDAFLREKNRKDEIINYLKKQEFLLYIHGFGSRFKPDSNKMNALEKVLPVIGINLDYSSDFETISSQIYSVILKFDVMLIAGTSLGGYWAAKKGAAAGIPFVAMNPAIEPKKTLRKYIGKGTTHYGEPYYLDKKTVSEYEPFSTGGAALILLDKGDDVLDYLKTKEMLDEHYRVVTFEGGSHRFEHIEESIEDIRQLIDNANLVYGLLND